MSLAAAAVAAPPTALPTSSTKVTERPVTRAYPRLDATGKVVGKATWRVTKAGGNCCEVLVASTKDGRLIEFGGTYVHESADAGETWQRISPLTPLSSGEGAVVAAPGGDVVGVGWDPYTGDHLQAFRYVAAEKKWHYSEMPLHEPFYDREWIAVAKGPFTIAGQTVPWVSLVLSNFHRTVVLMSLDGLSYFTPTARDLDALRTPRIERALPVRPDPDLDYLQGHSESRLVAVPGGGLLSFDNAVGCAVQSLNRDGSWSCFALPDSSVEGRLVADSRGWLHDVSIEADEVVYRLSRDGGRYWTERRFLMPRELTAESWDVKVNGRLGLSAIAVHGKDGPDEHQDLVLRVDHRDGVPRHRDTLLLGKGNVKFTAGVAGGDLRFDFATVAILPDGRIAASVGDSEFEDPAVAILAK
jgi:hypothetical protein